MMSSQEMDDEFPRNSRLMEKEFIIIHYIILLFLWYLEFFNEMVFFLLLYFQFLSLYSMGKRCMNYLLGSAGAERESSEYSLETEEKQLDVHFQKANLLK